MCACVFAFAGLASMLLQHAPGCTYAACSLVVAALQQHVSTKDKLLFGVLFFFLMKFYCSLTYFWFLYFCIFFFWLQLFYFVALVLSILCVVADNNTVHKMLHCMKCFCLPPKWFESKPKLMHVDLIIVFCFFIWYK